ncbi:MAG: MFS transporter [Mariprofundaceae bacterium]|nr:MFS transporter [Mariprofundaceae bacterium]
MVTTASLHSIRLFYAAYFAAMGLILPFFPLYLAERELDAVMIGVMTGLLAVAKVLAPPWVGHLADRSASGRSRPFIVGASLCAALFAVAMDYTVDVWWLAAVVLLFGMLWAAILPLTDGLSVSVSEAALADYGRLRVWGSIGFVVASLAGGIWLVDGNMGQFPCWLLGLMLLLALAARGFPGQQPLSDREESGNGRFGRPFITLLMVSFLMQVSHGAYYGFYSLYLVDLGYQGWQIGAFWVLGVIAEIVLMWGWSRPLQKVAPAWVLSAALLLATLRWLGIGLTEVWYGLLFWQLLHAASFAAFHLSAIAWVKRLAPANRHATAQGWYSASGFGLGSTIGIMGCGLIVSSGGYSQAFFVCAAIAFAGMLLAWQLPRRV